ncbi:hypothetical protein CCP3SC1AL1_1280003 [Gammaproteobacteria bacterium]
MAFVNLFAASSFSFYYIYLFISSYLFYSTNEGIFIDPVY